VNMILQDENMGQIFRRLRLERKLSQSAVAVKIQLLGSTMSRDTYAKIESGGRNIKISDLKIIKRVFDVSYDELLGDMEKIDSSQCSE